MTPTSPANRVRRGTERSVEHGSGRAAGPLGQQLRSLGYSCARAGERASDLLLVRSRGCNAEASQTSTRPVCRAYAPQRQLLRAGAPAYIALPVNALRRRSSHPPPASPWPASRGNKCGAPCEAGNAWATRDNRRASALAPATSSAGEFLRPGRPRNMANSGSPTGMPIQEAEQQSEQEMTRILTSVFFLCIEPHLGSPRRRTHRRNGRATDRGTSRKRLPHPPTHRLSRGGLPCAVATRRHRDAPMCSTTVSLARARAPAISLSRISERPSRPQAPGTHRADPRSGANLRQRQLALWRRIVRLPRQRRTALGGVGQRRELPCLLKRHAPESPSHACEGRHWHSSRLHGWGMVSAEAGACAQQHPSGEEPAAGNSGPLRSHPAQP